MSALLLAAVVTASGADVPQPVIDRARAVVERVLDGVEGDVRLELHRTAESLEAAVRRLDARAVPDAGYFHFASRTILVRMAPRADAALFADRLPGAMLAALVHEAHHARDLLLEHDFEAWPAWRIEGEGNAAAVRFLAASEHPGRGALALLLESRVWRARRARLFAPAERFERMRPQRLPLAQRATWYAQSYAAVRGPAWRPDPRWVLWRGSADPEPGRFRLVAEPERSALLVRRAPGPLLVEVTPLDVGGGQVELLFGFVSARHYAKVVFLRRGGVRAMWKRKGRWRRDSVVAAPPWPAGESVRLSLQAGLVEWNGAPLLYVGQRRGWCGVGVWDAAADFVIRPVSGSS